MTPKDFEKESRNILEKLERAQFVESSTICITGTEIVFCEHNVETLKNALAKAYQDGHLGGYSKAIDKCLVMVGKMEWHDLDEAEKAILALADRHTENSWIKGQPLSPAIIDPETKKGEMK